MAKNEWDVEFVRNQFPTFEDEQGRALVFLENAGGTYVPKQLIDHLDNFMIKTKVQPYGPYSSSQAGTKMILDATIKMAEMVNAEEDEIVIGHCTTMNLYLLSMALRNDFKAGDEIVVTNQDHESNISPWRRLSEFGIKIIEWEIDPQTGQLVLEDLEKLLSKQTRLVCMPHSSNIIGTVNDISVVAGMVHTAGAWLLVDGVSYAPHHEVDVKTLGADIYVLSLYKTFGPHLGLMYVQKDLHSHLENQSLEFMPELYERYRQPGSPNFLRIALNPGLVNHEEVASLNGLVDYFDTLYRWHFDQDEEGFHQRLTSLHKLIRKHETSLASLWMDYVGQQPLLKLIGSSETDIHYRSPTWSFRIKKWHPRDVAEKLAALNIAVQSGSFYAWRCLKAMGINPNEGVLRISLAHFNTANEIRKLCTALDRTLS